MGCADMHECKQSMKPRNPKINEKLSLIVLRGLTMDHHMRCFGGREWQNLTLQPSWLTPFSPSSHRFSRRSLASTSLRFYHIIDAAWLMWKVLGDWKSLYHNTIMTNIRTCPSSCFNKDGEFMNTNALVRTRSSSINFEKITLIEFEPFRYASSHFEYIAVFSTKKKKNK